MKRRAAAWAALGLLGGCASAEQEPQTPADEPAETLSEPAPRESVAEPAGADHRAALANPASRGAAVRTVLDEYARAAQHGSTKPQAQRFIDRYVGPLAEAYVAGHSSLDEKLRIELMTKLVSFNDPRAVPAHVKALQVYAATQGGTEEAIWACQAAQRMKDERLAEPLLEAFDAVDMADDDRHRLGRHLVAAMRNNASPKYRPRLMARLSERIERPESFNDQPAVKRYQNQLYWQSTAAQLLGEVGDSSAAKLLARVLLDPEKRDVHPHAEVSFVQLGEHAVGVAHGLLSGRDVELVGLAKKARPDAPGAPAYFATEWVIRLRHPSTRDQLLSAWRKTDDAQSKVLLARALTYFPKSAESIDAFQKTYASTPLSLTLPAGESALETLVDNSPYFFEPKLADWMMTLPGKVRGKGPRVGDVQRALVVAIGQLVVESQLQEAHKVSQRYGGRVGTPAYERSEALVRKCSEAAECYLGALKGLDGPDDADLQVADKALTMIGVFGSDAHRDALVQLLGAVSDPRLSNTLARVVAHLSTAPDEALLKAVNSALQQRGTSDDPRSAAAALPVRLLAYQLAARAAF